MPTNNPRVNVTLRPDTYARLQALSRATGNSMSNLVATLLDTQAEVFDRLVVVLEAADRAKEEAKAALGGAALSAELALAQERIENQLGIVFDLAEAETADLLEKASQVQRRAGRGGRAAPASPARRGRPGPPPTNRGVKK